MGEPGLPADASRRTRLANERTYLAWWRAGLTTLGVGIATGGIVPRLSDGAAWPYVVVGIGYSLLGMAFIVYGLRRLREVEAAVRRGEYLHPDDHLVIAFTACGVLLGLLTIGLLAYST